jgi:hypothetical protein
LQEQAYGERIGAAPLNPLECDGFFTAIIATHDQLQFDAYEGYSSGLGGRGMMQAILPEFVDYPQHLHALSSPCLSLAQEKAPSRDTSLSSVVGLNMRVTAKRQVVYVRHLVYAAATSQAQLGARLSMYD